MTVLYDDIGQNYAGQRQPDPHIAAAIENALTGCESVLNVGAVASELQKLRTDVDMGLCDQRYGTLRNLEFLDLGYRLVIARRPTSPAF